MPITDIVDMLCTCEHWKKQNIIIVSVWLANNTDFIYRFFLDYILFMLMSRCCLEHLDDERLYVYCSVGILECIYSPASVTAAEWGDRQCIPGLREHLQWMWNLHRWRHRGPRTPWDAWGCGDGQWYWGHTTRPRGQWKQVSIIFSQALHTMPTLSKIYIFPGCVWSL